ncbi:3884_t:CDS:2 [Paraglomus occultum]|uniref:3884_t:CDS:1 n=1 Tax=Paraglomus occultum TaxID=144539 RepID=A0A9N9CXF0_9GLOM|nr:3884_t:CDS:2 [Paraglomus occultum]
MPDTIVDELAQEVADDEVISELADEITMDYLMEYPMNWFKKQLMSSRRETIDTIAEVLDCEIVEENTHPLRRQSSNRSKRARVV